MLSRRIALASAGAIAGATLLSACGGSSSNGLAGQSPRKILSSALSAMSTATSTHLKGSVVTSTGHVTVDLTMFKNGDSDGTFGFSSTPGRLVIVGKTVYFKGSAKFWQGLSSQGGSSLPAAEAAKLADKWIQLPSSANNGFSSFTLRGFVQSIKKSSGNYSKVGSRTIDRQAAVGIKKPSQGTLWVATTGTAYPIEAVKSASGGNEQVTFSAWNQGTPPKAPSGAKSVTQVLTG